MIADIQISENGVVWDCETNKLLGFYPKHLSVEAGLEILGELKCQLARFEAVRDALRRDGHPLADMLDQSIEPLLAVREQPEVINERLVA